MSEEEGTQSLEVEEYIFENEIDDQAAQMLRECTAEVRAQVMGWGGLKDRKNPSAVLVNRIKAASRGHMSMSTNLPSANDVEDFLEANGIDLRAAETFRNLMPDLQARVMDCADLAGARNPSAMLVGLILECKGSGGYSGGGYNSRSSLYPTPPNTSPPCGSSNVGQDQMQWTDDCADSFGEAALTEEEVDRFLQENHIDERACEMFRQMTPEMQYRVMEGVNLRGGLSGTRNPSAVLVAAMRDTRTGLSHGGPAVGGAPMRNTNPPPPAYPRQYQGPHLPVGASSSWQFGGGGGRLGPPIGGQTKRKWSEGKGQGMEDVEDFIVMHDFSELAADELRHCARDVQERVIAQGDIVKARNPSSVLLARIRNEKSAASRVAPKSYKYGSSWDKSEGTVKLDVGDFIAENDVDEVTSAELRWCPPEVQQRVIARGNLRGARNPSAVLMARIREEKAGYGAEEDGGAPERSWRSGANGLTGRLNGTPNELPTWEDVEAFISSNKIGDEAADALREADPQVQHTVMSRDGLGNAWNPTAVVLARIRGAQSTLHDSDARFAKRTKGPPPAPPAAWRGAEEAPHKGGADQWQEMQEQDSWHEWPSHEWEGNQMQRDANTHQEDASASIGATDLPTFQWLVIPKNSKILEEYLLDLLPIAPATSYVDNIGLFEQADSMLADLVKRFGFDVHIDVVIDHGSDQERFPEVTEALEKAGYKDASFALAKCPRKRKWAVGVGAEWMERESAAKLALTVALAAGSDNIDHLNITYPEFKRLVSKTGIRPAITSTSTHQPTQTAMKESWEQDTWNTDDHQWDQREKYPQQNQASMWHQDSEKGGYQHSGYGYGGKGNGDEGRDSKYGMQGSQPESEPSRQNMRGLRHITLSEKAWLTEAGLRDAATVIIYEESPMEAYDALDEIFDELAVDVKFLSFHHEPESDASPEVGAELKRAGIMENSYCIVCCIAEKVWAVGIADAYGDRERAAKLAICVTIAKGSPKLKELSTTYKEFGELCAITENNKSTVAEPPPKRSFVESSWKRQKGSSWGGAWG